MKITNIRETVKKNPVLAILRGVSTDMLIDYVGAIKDGGVRFFEVALNTPDALVQIKMLKARFGDEIIVGAGTAITVKRAKAAVKAGAELSENEMEEIYNALFASENNAYTPDGKTIVVMVSTDEIEKRF